MRSLRHLGVVFVIVVILGAMGLLGYGIYRFGTAIKAAIATQPSTVTIPQAAEREGDPAVEADADDKPVAAPAENAGAKAMAPGWPVALAGCVYGTPAVADVEGNGKLCVVVPAVTFKGDNGLVHPKPSDVPLLYAMRGDGTSVPGWPIELGDPVDRPRWGPWASNPSVYHDQAGDHLVVISPQGAIQIINPDHTVRRIEGRVDAASSVPLVSLNHDGIWDIVCGSAVSTVGGIPIANWPASRRFKNGYAPAIGDARGDGKYIVFHLFYTAHDGHCPLAGFDATGQRLPGWPKMISDASWFSPVMGHITNDPGMQVVGAYGPHIFAWTLDAKPLACDTTDGDYVGVFKNGIEAQTATPTLADIDGDGKAEIIVFDAATSSIRAWHGDGTGMRPAAKRHGGWFGAIVGGSTPANADDGSVIAQLPGQAHGVSVVSLGDDPTVMDFFAGTSWVRWHRDGTTKIVDMCPDANNQTSWTQPTVCDLFGDGQAEAIFGLSDGRVIVYKTGLAFHADRAPWYTAQGNFQRTSALPLANATTHATK